jgi:hypothetical protein
MRLHVRCELLNISLPLRVDCMADCANNAHAFVLVFVRIGVSILVESETDMV